MRIELTQPAWKASVLPLNYTRLTKCTLQIEQSFIDGGGGRIRTFEDRSQRVYSPPHLTALVPLHNRRGSVPLFNKALNNMRFIYFIYVIAICDLLRKLSKKRVKLRQFYE